MNNFEVVYGAGNNIKALRNKVLELAIQGKLVGQNSNDEPSEYLLTKCKKLIKEKIKNGETTKPVSYDNSKNNENFIIPPSWKWVRLGEIALNNDSKRKPVSEKDRSSQEKIYDYYGATGVIDKVESYLFDGKFLLIGEDGGNFLNSKDVAFIAEGKFWANNHVHVLDFPEGISHEYIMNVLNYFDLKKLDYINGIAVPKLNQKNLNTISIPLPPAEEQCRIVDRVKELHVKIDKFEEKLIKKDKILELLSKAVVDAIGRCQNSEELKEQLQFVIGNFETVFQTPESMKDLRNVILQLAIEGKLVPQDINDEPASELVKKIKIEKSKMIKEGKIKKGKAMPDIEDGEIPFAIPNSWEWVRLGEIAEINPRNYLDDDLNVSFIPMKLIAEGYGSSHTSDVKKWSELKSGFTHFAENDIAIAKITPCFENRKSAILTDLKSGFGAGTTELHIVRTFSPLILRKYLLYIFKTQWFIISGSDTFTGTAGQQRISTDFMKEYTIPIPPTNEQLRIVQKVESIMKLIGEMEKKLKRKIELVEKMANK